jgi:hypothetical protein
MYSALGPVAEAVVVVLQDPTLQAAAIGGIWDDLPQNPQFPCVWFELQAIENRGLGRGGLPRLELRTHVFSDYGGLMQAREIDRLIIGLLRDQPVPVDPALYTCCGETVWNGTIPVADEELNGVKVHELVSIFTIWVEEVAA